MTNHVLVNVVAGLLSSYAIAIGSIAWFVGPALAHAQAQAQATPGIALVSEIPQGFSASDAGFWSGVFGLAVVVVNAVAGNLGKRQDAQLDRLKVELLTKAADSAEREIAELKAALAQASASASAAKS